MIHRLAYAFSCIVVVCGSLALVNAQTRNDNPKNERHHEASVGNAFTVFGNATFANTKLYGDATQRHLFLVGIAYRHILMRKKDFFVSYAPELVPIAVLLQPHPSLPRPSVSGNGTVLATSPGAAPEFRNSIGTGINPVGFELSFLPNRGFHPFLAADCGFLYFNRNVPSAAAAQFNFAAAGRIGVQLATANRSAISIGYEFHHFSNADEAHDNPGLDSEMIFVGYTFGRRQNRSEPN